MVIRKILPSTERLVNRGSELLLNWKSSKLDQVVEPGYAAAFYFLSLTLKSIPVGIAYAVWSGLGIVLVTAIAWVLHGQKLDMWGFVGVGFIISGVAVLNLLSKASVH